MGTTAESLMTAEEFARVHGGETFVELVDGRVVREPMPHRKHGLICNAVAFELTQFVRRAGAGRVMTNDTYVMTKRGPDTLRGADVLYISYARLPKDANLDEITPDAPELVFEVRSPSNRWTALVAKALEYLNAGVQVVALIDPDSETVSVYRQDEIQQVLHNDDELTFPDVLPGFAVPVKQFFE